MGQSETSKVESEMSKVESETSFVDAFAVVFGLSSISSQHHVIIS